jgi:hypothetical protein
MQAVVAKLRIGNMIDLGGVRSLGAALAKTSKSPQSSERVPRGGPSVILICVLT